VAALAQGLLQFVQSGLGRVALADQPPVAPGLGFVVGHALAQPAALHGVVAQVQFDEGRVHLGEDAVRAHGLAHIGHDPQHLARGLGHQRYLGPGAGEADRRTWTVAGRPWQAPGPGRAGAARRRATANRAARGEALHRVHRCPHG
jgi:hypothetical protein